MSFFQRLGRWALGHRALILGVMGLLTALALVQTRLLRFDFQPSAMMQVSDEDRALEAAVIERYKAASDDVLLMVLHSPQPDAVLTPYGLSLLHRFHELAVQSGLATDVQSLANVPRIPEGLTQTPSKNPFGALAALFQGDLFKTLSAPPEPLINARPASDDDVARVRARLHQSVILPGTLISEDGSTALITLKLHPRFADLEQLSPALEALEQAAANEIQRPDFAAALGEGPAFEIRFGGLPHIRTETVRNLKRDQLIYWPIVGAVFFFMMLALFRSPWQALLPLVAVGLATIWIVGLLATINQEVNIINNITPTLILVVGICDGIHVVLYANRQRRESLDPLQTSLHTIADLGLPCLLTSLTSAIGFASLVVSHAEVLQNFGWQVGLGIMLAYSAVILMVPISLTFLKPRALPTHQNAQEEDWIGRAIASLTDSLLAHPKVVLGVAFLALAATVAAGSRVPIDAHAIEAFVEGDPIYETNHLIEQKLGGILPLELELTIQGQEKPFEDAQILAKVAAFQDFVSQQPGVISTMSVLNILAEAQSVLDNQRVDWRVNPEALAKNLPLVALAQPDQLAQYLSEDRAHLRLTARMSDAGIRRTLATIDTIRANPPPQNPSMEVQTTGIAYLTAIGLDLFVRDLFMSLATASAIIFGIMMIAFRSWRVGLISVLPNILPLTITLAVMPLFGYQLNTSSVVIFTISIGLSVDNTIHFVSRLRDVRPAYPTINAAIHAAFSTSGRAILASNLLLIIGFSVLFLSGFEPTRRVATLTVVTIIASLVTALLTLPVLLRLFYEPRAPKA